MSNSPSNAALPLDPMTMPLQGLHVIEASAGTGKTWTLAALYVRLVLGHQRQCVDSEAGLYPPQILVMTFTEAATAELRGRIRERLAQAARFFRVGEGGTAEADEFLHRLRQDFASSQWIECADSLDMAAQWMDDAAIFTIHGWSSRMLKTHAFDSASLFQQSRVEDSHRLKLTAVQDYWRKWFYPLPVEQLKALKSLGRTPDELLENMDRLWAVSDKAPQVSAAQFDEPDALLEKWSRWQNTVNALQALARAAWTAELVPMVRDAASRKAIKGYRADWLAGWLEQMAQWAEGNEIELKTLERFSSSVLVSKNWTVSSDHIAFSHIDALCMHLRNEPDVARGLQSHAAQEIGTAYRQAKKKLAQFDFSDLLQNLYYALQVPNGRLAAAIRQQYPVALVDEFQDTDPWQYGALSKIYGESSRSDTGLIMIGDPKQAIYSFRGADLDTYLAARQQAQDVHTLSGNFRSTPGVVAAVNHIFSRVDQPFGEIPFETVVASNPDIHPLQRNGTLQPALTVWHLANAASLAKDEFMRQMAALFATQMVDLLNQGVAEPGHMAVLVRGWREAAAIRHELAVRGVRSVYLSERDSVFSSPQASDLWRILLAVANPRSTHRVRAALATRLWGLEWADLEALFQNEMAWDNLVDQFHGWQKIWQKQGFLPMLHRLLHDQSIPSRLMNHGNESGHDGERQLTNLLHLGDLLQSASVQLQGENALVRYLEEQLRNPGASGDAAQLRLESDANLVQVVTIHKAKGLQYPLVFLPFVSSFMAEKKDSGKDDDLRLAEDVRLLYVALTRAEKALWVGVAQVKGDVEGKSPQVRSAVSRLLQRKTADDLADRLACWSECADIVVEKAPPAETRLYTPEVEKPDYKSVLEPQRRLDSRWWTASFSALTKQGLPQFAQGARLDSERDSRLADAQLDSSAEADSLAWTELSGVVDDGKPVIPLTYNGFPAGSVYGTLLHDLLEWQAQRGWPATDDVASAGVSAEWSSLMLRKSRNLISQPDQLALMGRWIKEILLRKLPLQHDTAVQHELNLASLMPDQMWPEMAFTLTVKNVDALGLDHLIHQHIAPGQGRRGLQPRQLEGMLVGFMDLVIEHQGRYYVLDYKSNWLPAYDAAQLQQAVLLHRYDVQYTLYLLALHRLLKSRLPGYDYDEHIGGALYLFLRGIDQPGSGLLQAKPPRELIERLDLVFTGKLQT